MLTVVRDEPGTLSPIERDKPARTGSDVRLRRTGVVKAPAETA